MPCPIERMINRSHYNNRTVITFQGSKFEAKKKMLSFQRWNFTKLTDWNVEYMDFINNCLLQFNLFSFLIARKKTISLQFSTIQKFIDMHAIFINMQYTRHSCDSVCWNRCHHSSFHNSWIMQKYQLWVGKKRLNMKTRRHTFFCIASKNNT